MLISNLVKHLEEKASVEMLQRGEDRSVRRLLLAGEEQDPSVSFEDLYLCCQSQAGKNPPALRFLSELSNQGEEGEWIFRMLESDFHRTLAELSDRLYQEQQRELAFYRLTDKVMAGSSLHEIVNAMSLFLERSLVLTDMSLYVLDYSTSVTVTDPLWIRNIERGYCTYEFFSAVRELLPQEMEEATDEAQLANCRASQENKLFSLLLYQDEPIGYLIMLDNEAGVLDFHWEYLPRLSRICVQLMKQRPEARRLFSSVAENIIIDLLAGGDIAMAENRLFSTGMELPPNVRCLAIEPPSRTILDLPYLLSLLRELFPDCLSVIQDERILAITQENHLVRLTEREGGNPFLQSVRRIGLSPAFSSLKELPRMWKHAKRCCEIADILDKPGKVLDYHDFCLDDVLLSCSDPELLMESIHPALFLLHEYDRRRNKNLYQTLQQYVQRNGNAKETAEALYLHRNTLIYRLHQIREMTNLNLESMDTLFRLEYSFRVCRLLQLFS